MGRAQALPTFMGWYTVTKTINGRQYLYLQMTYRENGKVKTKNEYLGPAAGGFGSCAPANLPTSQVKMDEPAAGLRVDKIRRLKPKRREIQNREATKQRLIAEARANLDDIKQTRKNGEDVTQMRFMDRIYRYSYKSAFGKTLKTRKP